MRQFEKPALIDLPRFPRRFGSALRQRHGDTKSLGFTAPEIATWAIIHRARQLPWLATLAAALLLLFGVELFLSARIESQTFDEPAHLYAGYSHWLRSDFGVNPEHPPLAKLVAALPLLIERPLYPEPRDTNFHAVSAAGGWQLMNNPGAASLLGRARAAVSVFAFLLAGLVASAAWEMFGRRTALFALLLFVFDPLMLGHAALVTTDVAATCFVFATFYVFYRYVKRRSILRLALCGLAGGLALGAKHSAVFAFVILFLLCAAMVALGDAPPEGAEPDTRVALGRLRMALRLGASLLAIGTISVAILWAFYGFRYQARPGGKQITPPTAEYLKGLHSPAEAGLIGFAERHHLLPEAYLYGLTDVAILCREGRVMYLFGTMYPSGRWFYFPAAFLIKCTLGFLALLLLIPLAPVPWMKQYRREILFLALPPIAFFGYAMTAKLDIGIRHIMPVFPFLMVLAAAGAVSLTRRSRPWAWAVSALLVLHAASSLRAFPNYLPYSNELFGGPRNTYRFLSDSNVGWGGGLKALSSYLRRHQITDCWLGSFALPDPASFGIPCRRLPATFSLIAGFPQNPVPGEIHGPVFISSEEIAGGLIWGTREMSPYRKFFALRPAQVIAGEILEYDGTFHVKPLASLSESVFAVDLLRRQHKPDEAVQHAELGVALDPQSMIGHDVLAYLYAADKQPDRAMHEYQTALSIFNTVPSAYRNNMRPPRNPLGNASSGVVRTGR